MVTSCLSIIPPGGTTYTCRRVENIINVPLWSEVGLLGIIAASLMLVFTTSLYLWSFLAVPACCDEAGLELLIVFVAQLFQDACCWYHQRRGLHLNTGLSRIKKDRGESGFNVCALGSSKNFESVMCCPGFYGLLCICQCCVDCTCCAFQWCVCVVPV